MATIYFTKIGNGTDTETIKKISRNLLEKIIAEEQITLSAKIPLKVHFGEKGNHTYIRPENYDGVIDFLQGKSIETCFMETSVMYGGQRNRKDLHLKTAAEHGFTRVPVVIADGDQGEKFAEVTIERKHFKTCKIGRDFLDYDQLIVISHFKGHMAAGFGGAIKQLSMGHASKGGKLAMHMGIKPHIVNRKCKKCQLCETRCNENAITIGKKSFIDHTKCVGCGACVAICPHKAVSIFSLKGILTAFGFKDFREKLVEYAVAAQKGKRNIYMNFAMTVTAGCDCEPRKMKPVVDNFGIFIATDPVAIDKACHDMAASKGKRFRGAETFAYAEKIGLGSTDYTLVEV